MQKRRTEICSWLVTDCMGDHKQAAIICVGVGVGERERQRADERVYAGD